MPGHVQWKTPDGSRPSIYYMLSVYWRDGPVWLPFLFAALFGFVLWTSVLPQSLGLTLIIAGAFCRWAFWKKSIREKPLRIYRDREANHPSFVLAKDAGQLVYRWPDLSRRASESGVRTYEAKHIPSETGVVLGLWRNGVEILSPAQERRHLTRHINRFDAIDIFLYVLGAFPVIILSVLFLLIVCGMIDGVRRMIHAVGKI